MTPPEPQKLTILFVLPNLKSGGAERTILNVVNHLDRKRFKPILALYQRSGTLLEQLHEDVEVIDLKTARARYTIFSLVSSIRRLRPAVILSTVRYANASTVLAAMLARSRVPVVVRETNNFTAAGLSSTNGKERIVGWCYRRARLVVALSEGVKQDVMLRYAIAEDQIRTIYNPVDIEEIRQLIRPPLPEFKELKLLKPGSFRLIAVGHLKPQKGFDLLIQAVSRLTDIPLHLVIVGDGPEDKNLQQLINDSGLADRVKLVGYQENPYAWMAQSDLFVLSSRWEGFGHVIAEAMACGVPVLATRCPSGPDEIIHDGVTGRLCEPDSIEALAAGIRELWTDQASRLRYAKNAHQAVQRFNVNVITKKYEQMLMDVHSLSGTLLELKDNTYDKPATL